MTLIFAISGIALNHIEDWDSNYQVSQSHHQVSGINAQIESDSFEPWLLQQLGVESKIKARYWESPTQYKLFAEQGVTFIVQPQKNQVTIETVEPRPIFRGLNFLHLNEAKQFWTWFSDLYALALCYLAISALFMIKGRKGVMGRGGYLVATGFVLPLAFYLFYSA